MQLVIMCAPIAHTVALREVLRFVRGEIVAARAKWQAAGLPGLGFPW